MLLLYPNGSTAYAAVHSEIGESMADNLFQMPISISNATIEDPVLSDIFRMVKIIGRLLRSVGRKLFWRYGGRKIV